VEQGDDHDDPSRRGERGGRDDGVDYDTAGERYDRTRGRTAGTAAYGGHVRRELADAPAGPVLDLGSGTGAWSRALATWSGRDVVGLEPSAGMRGMAATNRRRDSPRPAAMGATRGPATTSAAGDGGVVAAGEATAGRVHLVGGRADGVPLRDGVAGAAWLSTVIHHVGDLDACANELRRVLAPGAPVLIRSAFPGRYDGIGLVRFFPATRRALDRFPSVDAVRAAFEGAGFRFAGIQRVDEPPVGYRRWRERLPSQRLADTILVGLTDDEFAAGLRALDAAIAAGRDPEAVGLDLLVLH
jgi:SAM-dependent methyltransferase